MIFTLAESLTPARISHKHDIQNSKPHASIMKTRSCNIQTFSAVKINKFHEQYFDNFNTFAQNIDCE